MATLVRNAILAVVAVLLAGCENAGPAATPGLPVLADFHGCNLTLPDGSPLTCQEPSTAVDAPSWALGTCFTEDNRFDDWLAIVQWTAHDLFGMGADLTPGRQAVMSLETNGRRHLLHLTSSGQVAFEMQQDFGEIEGFAITFEEQVTLTVQGKVVPVKVHWQTMPGGDPLATYEADGGYWFHNVTTFRAGNTTFLTGFGSFNLTGQDFHLSVERTIYQNIGVGLQGHYTGRPCFGPES